MGYIMWIQKEVYPKETLKVINIDHRDLAGSMQEEIEMLMRVMRKIELAVRAERIQQAEDAVAEIEDDIDDQARDPTYVEETDSESDEARDPSYVQETDIESDVSEQIPFYPIHTEIFAPKINEINFIPGRTVFVTSEKYRPTNHRPRTMASQA